MSVVIKPTAATTVISDSQYQMINIHSEEGCLWFCANLCVLWHNTAPWTQTEDKKNKTHRQIMDRHIDRSWSLCSSVEIF